MALLARGSTRCPICGDVIAEGDAATTFESFVANERDPLFVFSDAAFHESCVDAHPNGDAARDRAAHVREHSLPGNRRCVVCGEPIQDPDDYLDFGYLTGDTGLTASRLNYVQLHRSHIREWWEIGPALQALEELRDSGMWRGGRLDTLSAELRKHAT